MNTTRSDNELMKWYETNWRGLYAEDDVSGPQLDPTIVIKARRAEFKLFRNM